MVSPVLYLIVVNRLNAGLRILSALAGGGSSPPFRTTAIQGGTPSFAQRAALNCFSNTLVPGTITTVDPRAYGTLAAKRAIAEHGAVTPPSDLT